MRLRAASIDIRMRVPSTRKNAFIMRLAGCFLSVSLATIFVGLTPEANLIWVANGVMLAYLLLAPRHKWPAYLCAGYVAQLTGGLLVGHHGIVSAMVLTFLNLSESLISALFLRRRSTQLPDFTNPRYVARFIAFGVIAGPVLMGAINALLSPLWHQATPGAEFLEWVASDGLGACVATPACVAIFRTHFRKSLYSLNNWAHLIPVVVCAAVAFSQARLPVPFLLYPLLVLVLLRLSLGWAALASLLVAAIGSSFTVRGHGPFAVSASTTPLESAMLLQLFLASAMVILYSVSVVIESLRNTERRLHEIAAIHNLITENSRDAIILADLKGSRKYVSSASESIGGWKPEELMEQGSFDLIHPDDRPGAEARVSSLGSACENASMEIRIRNRKGDYIWVDSSLRVARDPETGAPYGILNIVRDITQRRRAEQAREFHDSLMRAIHEVTLDGILVVDNAGNIAAINRKFSDVWRGAESDLPAGAYDGTLALSDQELLSRCINMTKDPEPFIERVQQLYADPDANDSCHIELKDDRILERYTTGLRNNSGQYLGRVWFFRDVTDRIIAEKQLKEAYRAVEVLAVTDALTGLANRRQFDRCLTTEWRRAMRGRNPLSLLLIDADLFKSYNDNYGHLRGDSCLKQIAAAAQGVVTRSGDVVARFGGEEFAVILPDTLKDGAVAVADAIAEALRAHKLVHKGSPAGIMTVSIGCATLIPQLGQNSASLVELADRALYKAKGAGRNRVCTSGPECCTAEEQFALGIQNIVTDKAS